LSLLRLFIRIAVAAGLTGYILWKSHPSDVLAAARAADWRWIGAAVALVAVDRTLMAYRWVALLCTVPPEDRPPLPALMRIFFVSTFLGTFLPASVGADAVRAYSTSRLKVRVSDAVASVFMDRMLGVASLLLAAVVGLTLARDLAANTTILVALGASAAVCGVTLLVVFNERAAALASGLVGWLPKAVQEPGRQIVAAIRRYAGHHAQLANVLVCSVAVQGLRIVQAYYLGRSLGLTVPFSAYVAFVPLILLVMLLPVTFNGIGTSQAAFVWFFGRAGVPASSGFTLSVLFVALGIVGNLPGGILYAAGRSGPARDRG
jgi:hypothetical protein